MALVPWLHATAPALVSRYVKLAPFWGEHWPYLGNPARFVVRRSMCHPWCAGQGGEEKWHGVSCTVVHRLVLEDSTCQISAKMDEDASWLNQRLMAVSVYPSSCFRIIMSLRKTAMKMAKRGSTRKWRDGRRPAKPWAMLKTQDMTQHERMKTIKTVHALAPGAGRTICTYSPISPVACWAILNMGSNYGSMKLLSNAFCIVV